MAHNDLSWGYVESVYTSQFGTHKQRLHLPNLTLGTPSTGNPSGYTYAEGNSSGSGIEGALDQIATALIGNTDNQGSVNAQTVYQNLHTVPPTYAPVYSRSISFVGSGALSPKNASEGIFTMRDTAYGRIRYAVMDYVGLPPAHFLWTNITSEPFSAVYGLYFTNQLVCSKSKHFAAIRQNINVQYNRRLLKLRHLR